MARFDAATAVDELEYDFTKYVSGCKGIIPEPSRDQITDFFDTVKSLKSWAKAAKDAEESGDEADMTEFIANLDENEIKDKNALIMKSLGELCSQQPSTEQIMQLPFRVQQAFMAWLTESLNPKVQPQDKPATKR